MWYRILGYVFALCSSAWLAMFFASDNPRALVHVAVDAGFAYFLLRRGVLSA